MFAYQIDNFLLELTEKAKRLHAEERRVTLESVKLVGELEMRKVWFSLGVSVEKYAQIIGLSASQYWKRAAAARVISSYPLALELYENAEIELSHLSMIAGRITAANHQLILEGIRGKTKRDAETFLSRVTADGRLRDREGYIEFTVRLTESQQEVFERAREVLAHSGHVPSNIEIILQAAMDLLEKRDPLKKAERAETRKEKTRAAASTSKPVENNKLNAHALQVIPSGETTTPQHRREPVPGAVKNAVWLRDRGCCTYLHPDGTQCTSKMMIEIDHILMVCRGGQNTIDNLRLRCRYHNQLEAELLLHASRARKTRN